jgi:hypothetical protein
MGAVGRWVGFIAPKIKVVGFIIDAPTTKAVGFNIDAPTTKAVG